MKKFRPLRRRQELHPDLTLTGIYNVLEKLRSGEVLTAKDKVIYDKGLVSVLKQIHDELDAAVLEAYGWSDLKRGTGGPPVSSPTEHGQAARAPLADILARGGPEGEALEQQLLTLTGIYNVLEKLRSGEVLTAKDKVIYDKGLVSILKQIHDELDAEEGHGRPARDFPNRTRASCPCPSC
jgi:hypothetical protein